MGRLVKEDALIEELKTYEEELKKDREIAIETDDEQMLFAIMNQETAICRIRRNVLHMPTAYDVEKVVAELENGLKNLEHNKKLFEDNQAERGVFMCDSEITAFKMAIDIVKAGGVE